MKNSVRWFSDSNLVSLASLVNNAPMALARTETQAWANEAVHGLAADMLRDHAAFQVSIDSLAGKLRLPSQRPAVADGMQASYDSAITPMTVLVTEQREAKFLDATLSLHAKTISDFGAIAGNASDPDLRALLATRGVLMEQTHVAKAQLIAAAVTKADSSKAAERAAKKP